MRTYTELSYAYEITVLPLLIVALSRILNGIYAYKRIERKARMFEIPDMTAFLELCRQIFHCPAQGPANQSSERAFRGCAAHVGSVVWISGSVNTGKKMKKIEEMGSKSS